MRNPKQLVSEMWNGFTNWDISRTTWFGPVWGSLRSLGTGVFFKKPIMQGTVVNYDLARSLYRNDNPEYQFGAGFARPIIDLTVEYMGVPSVSNDDTGDSDAWLNECLHDHWAPQLQQIFRDATRDSKTWVRFRQPRTDNPLFTDEDRMHGRLEVIPPEEVDVQWNPVDPDLIDMVVLTHDYRVDKRTPEEVANNRPPRMETHEIQEIITPSEYRFYDKTASAELKSWTMKNILGFVPMWPVWNEYAADLGGGQSELEAALPFIKAFHDVMVDTLSAHKYHSTPKAKFVLKDVTAFVKNNWPDAIDETNGRIKPGAKIQWSGKEIMFFGPDEDAGFIEAVSVLGDSKTLLEFLLDCIAIASETPKWALLASTSAVTQSDATVKPFEKKIERKRVMFSECVVMLCKMALVAKNANPETQRVTWPPINLGDLASKGQSIQQLVMAFDVASTHGWISDVSVVKILAAMFPEMSAPDIEMELAKDNIVPEIPAPAPASSTQGAPSSSNGNGTKRAAKAALATTAPSNS